MSSSDGDGTNAHQLAFETQTRQHFAQRAARATECGSKIPLDQLRAGP
jgi:hypothetical protein